MAQFTEERLEADSNAEVRTSVLYDDYRTWCYGNGCYCENSRNFINELRKFGTVERRRPKSGGEKTTLLIGYKLRPHPDDFLK
jgi:putative DNA primase/helicase